MFKPNSDATFRGGGGANYPLIATVSGLLSKLGRTGRGFAKKGTKLLRYYGTKSNRHCEGGKATLCATNVRNYLSRHCEERSDEAISLKLQASVQRNVAIASDRDLREQNTECAVRHCNDVVGAVPIHSNVRFSFFGSFSFFLHHNKKKEMNKKKRDCFATLAMTNVCHSEGETRRISMPWRKFINLEILRFAQDDVKWVCNDKRVMKKCAFTLSEVLIVLAVLGVVAAMTIPDLIQDYREKATVTAVKKAYTVLSQAVDMAVADNGPVETWDWGTRYSGQSAVKVFDEYLKPNLKLLKDCGQAKGCWYNGPIKYLHGDDFANLNSDSSAKKALLIDGSSITLYTYGGCNYNAGSSNVLKHTCAYFYIDTNGIKSPNTLGKDVFGFHITPDGIIPYGTQSGHYQLSSKCNINSTSSENGKACTAWVIKKENMDYLRETVSW